MRALHIARRLAYFRAAVSQGLYAMLRQRNCHCCGGAPVRVLVREKYTLRRGNQRAAANSQRRPVAGIAIGPAKPGIRLSYSLSIDALCRGLGPKIIRLMLFQMPIGPGRTSPLGHTRTGRLPPNRQLAASGRREQA